MVCRTHDTEAFFGSSGECALAVPFQDAFGKSFRDSATVKRNKRAACPLAVIMDKLRCDFLAGAGFPKTKATEISESAAMRNMDSCEFI
jgi:hypothetical protein